MKDTERERTTAELEAWQLKQKEKAEEESQLKLQTQRGNQEKVKAVTQKHENGSSGGRTVKLCG